MDKRRANFFLRYDVGGEIVDSDEVSRLVQLAKDYSHFIIWTYTKNHAAVNAFVKENGDSRKSAFPDNLVIMFSNINAEEIENPFDFPVFNCVTKAEGKAIDADYCNGDCYKCRQYHLGCIAGQSMNVDEH